MDGDEITKQYMDKLNKFTKTNNNLDLELDALMNDDPELQMFMNHKNNDDDLDKQINGKDSSIISI
jgi:hypothetical protein